jgi:hypothetical protein
VSEWPCREIICNRQTDLIPEFFGEGAMQDDVICAFFRSTTDLTASIIHNLLLE